MRRAHHGRKMTRSLLDTNALEQLARVAAGVDDG